MRSPWARDDEEYIVDDEHIIQLACYATGAYDKETWYSGEVPDDVWAVVASGSGARVGELIEAGATWGEALDTTAEQA